jgi:glycerophosphoryl diester phosphodiesterase
MKKRTIPWRIAHRGARGEAPDNTAPALQKALTYPIDGIEFDVQMSADGRAVLYHDRTIWRLNRRRKHISDLAFSELEALDWGAWFSPAFSGEPPLTLVGALEVLHSCPRLLIELKSNPRDRRTGHVRRLAETVVSILKRKRYRPLQDRILILSFDPDVLAQAHDLAPEYRYVLNCSDGGPSCLRDLPAQLAGNLWAVDIRIGMLPAERAHWAADRTLRLMTYTCNNIPQVQKALALGVDAIISDRPLWLADHLAQHFARVP